MFSAALRVLLCCTALCLSAQTRADWQQAYLFAYPLVLMDVTREASGAANTLTHSRAFPTDKFRTIVRPNADTLYSSAWLDLSKEPMLVRVPDTHGRYYLLQILDAWTETVAVPGKRTTGTGEGWFAIVGPGWTGKLPDQVKQRIDCPTNMAWLLGRTQTNGPADYANVHKIQDGFQLMSLSKFPDGVKSKRAGPAAVAASGALTPPEIVHGMGDAQFFARFARLLAANPAHAADAPMLERLRKLGPLDAAAGEELAEGVKSARAMLGVVEQLRTTVAGASGWTAVNPNVGRYGTNYIARAVVARIGLGANPPEDAVYLSCYKDPSGKPLEGSAAGYRMHFEKSALPPVEAFWSITVYDADGYFVANPVGRYALGDRDPLRFNADGSLDLYLQSAAPPVGWESNWLPVPAGGRFNLSFRLYWPKAEVLSGKWGPPPVLRAE